MVRLTREQLAAEADVPLERVDALVRIGAVRPATDESFSSADVQRVRLVEAYEAAGIGLDLVGLAIERRWIDFEQSESIYPETSPKSDRTVAQFRDSLGEHGGMLAPLLVALGLPSREDDARLTVQDEALLEAFVMAWDLGPDPDVAIRAGRLVGESVRRTTSGWLDLFAEQVTRPLEDRTRTADELAPIVVPRAAAIVRQSPAFLIWLFQRHLETGVHALNVASMEAGLAREGLLPPRPVRPEAIAFVDLAGFTALTQSGGDELAARSATTLAELADTTARPNGGRLVKLLGDGAMLHFGDAPSAVIASLDLIDAIAAAGLPPGHGGIAAGPLVSRDGDYFGHTVNLAARLSGAATGGTLLVTQEVADLTAAESAAVRFRPLGGLELKNVAEPVAAFRAERAG